MTQAENTIETVQLLAAPKIRYLIQDAKDKMATANSEKNAKQIAKKALNLKVTHIVEAELHSQVYVFSAYTIHFPNK